MKRVLRFLLIGGLLCFSPISAGSLIHYWNFNSVSSGVSGAVDPSLLPPVKADFTIGDTSIVKMHYKTLPGTGSGYKTYWDVNAGIDTNARMGAAAGNSIRLRNPSDSMQLVLFIPSLGYKDIVIGYAVQRSSAGNGATIDSFSYSVDSGATWKIFGLSRTSASTNPAWSSVISIAISDPLANNNPRLAFRILFTGGQNTGTSGNNRIDNVSVEGTPIPINPIVNIIYSSDQHYGITRPRFQQASNVNAQPVNRAMIRKMNSLPQITTPNDSGVNALKKVGEIDYLISTGDIANRQEGGVQRDSLSWEQFRSDYNDSVAVLGRSGLKATLLLSPGNHDISNAIGYTSTLVPALDRTSMVEMYNRMVRPTVPATNANYDFHTEKVNYSRDIAGLHCQFINFWPDSANRVWMDSDLVAIPDSVPVIIFTHSPPTCESKNYTNPNGTHTINPSDKFQNLLEEQLKDGARTVNDSAKIELQEFADFLKRHRNIKAYFHGHDNANEFYTWTGPNHDVSLPTYRVDSPMKGNFSKADETKLSFQLISIDSVSKRMTVRECLWNPDSIDPNAAIVWGRSSTISLASISVAKPIILANGQAGYVSVPGNQFVDLTISLAANAWKGKQAEYWVYGNTPVNATYNGERYFYDGRAWSLPMTPLAIQPLSDMPTRTVLTTGDLSPGSYTVYFLIDTILNGTPDTTGAIDSVTFIVSGLCRPSITVNGNASDVILHGGDPVNVAVSLATKGWAGTACDYFIYYDDPDGKRSFYHASPDRWTSGASFQGNAGDVTDFPVLTIANFSQGPGTYVFYFTIDNVQNGIMDGSQVTASVRMTVQ